MSARNSHTTADYIPWDSAINVIHRLYKDGNYRMSLFIATGIFTGLRVTDLRSLRWSDLMNGDNVLAIVEHKTKKRREIKLGKDFLAHVKDCYAALQIQNPNEHCFLSQKKTVYSIQRLNIMLKEIKTRYRLPIKNISCHALRKTMGRAIFERCTDNKEMALIKLSQIYGHSSTMVTRRYLALQQEEILQAYDLLSF
ncbi:MAG: integrase/recombinase [bacterium F083]|nr:MAG: integrase/recombinase [bacterium F083]